MAILSVNNCFLKANGKILVGPESGGDIIFLTYFDNFDESTGTDIPIVGDPYTLDIQKQKLTRSSLNLFGGDCPALKDEYKSNNFVGFSKPIPEDVEFISAELFLLCEGTRIDYHSILGFGVADIKLDPYLTSTSFPVFGPDYTGSSSDYTMFNGTLRVNNSFRFGKNIRYKTSHLAITYDVINKIVRFYVDGDIMLEIRNYQTSYYRFRFVQSNTGKSFTLTGVAYFSYDKSTNDGMNYPVPTQRYA